LTNIILTAVRITFWDYFRDLIQDILRTNDFSNDCVLKCTEKNKSEKSKYWALVNGLKIDSGIIIIAFRY